MVFNVVPCLFTLAAKLINVPGNREVIDKINSCAVGVRRDNLYPVGIANLHELTVLLSPTVTKQSIYLRRNNNFHQPDCNVSEHLDKGGTDFPASLVRETYIVSVHV